MPVTLEVNGETHVVDAPPTRRLLSVLRDDLALTGAKLGCGEGACGACAVLLDGLPVASCLVPAGAAEGRAVTTIEGLTRTGAELQEAFVAEDALQCGFCTPGQIVTATALLAAHAGAEPSRRSAWRWRGTCAGAAPIRRSSARSSARPDRSSGEAALRPDAARDGGALRGRLGARRRGRRPRDLARGGGAPGRRPAGDPPGRHAPHERRRALHGRHRACRACSRRGSSARPSPAAA